MQVMSRHTSIGHRTIRCLGAALAAATVCAASLSAATPKALFAEPASGRPVDRYALSLRTRSGQREYQVPGDCQQIGQLHQAGDAARDRVVDRRRWLKAVGDCRYFGLLNRHAGQGLSDHLVGYDFDGLALDDLPDGIQCSGLPIAWCSRDLHSGHQRLALFPRSPERTASDATVPCRLENGLLRASVWRTTQGLVCVPDRRARVRLLGTDPADIDGDGIRDRVLHLLVISPESGRRTLRLPLTRVATDAPLTVPGIAPGASDQDLLRPPFW